MTACGGVETCRGDVRGVAGRDGVHTTGGDAGEEGGHGEGENK